jgi:hypothetical protein
VVVVVVVVVVVAVVLVVVVRHCIAYVTLGCVDVVKRPVSGHALKVRQATFLNQVKCVHEGVSLHCS